MLIGESSTPVILSSAAPWRDILVIERHGLTARQWQESERHHYSVIMTLTAPGQLEWRTGYREQDHSCQGSAGHSLFTTESPIWGRQAHEANAVVAALDPKFVARIARAILDVDPQRPTQTLAFSDAGIENLLLALRSELIDGCPRGRRYGESLATALATRLLWSSAKASRSSSIGGLTPGRLRRILDYINTNLADDTRVARLAARSNMSPPQFARLFLQNMGMTPHQYIVRTRIAAAKELLRDGQLSLAEIGYTLGFPNQAHFTTTFRNRVGLTPSAFCKLRSST